MFIIGIVGSSDIKNFSSGLSGIDLSRQVQISVDGQYWNQKFCEEVKQERENIDHSGLSNRVAVICTGYTVLSNQDAKSRMGAQIYNLRCFPIDESFPCTLRGLCFNH